MTLFEQLNMPQNGESNRDRASTVTGQFRGGGTGGAAPREREEKVKSETSGEQSRFVWFDCTFPL